MGKSAEDTFLEIAQLQARLSEAEQLLRTLGPGVVGLSDQCRQARSSDLGPPVPIRASQGLAVLAADGRILCCSSRLAHMVQVRPDRLLGSTMYEHVSANSQATLADILNRSPLDRTSREIDLITSTGRSRSIRIFVQPAHVEGAPGACMVLADRDAAQRLKRSRQAGYAAAIAEGEQQRVEQDLQDVLGQTLAAIALLGETLHQRLQVVGCPEAGKMGQIIGLVHQGLKQLRSLAGSLQAVGAQPDGLRKALGEFAADISAMEGVACRFEWDGQAQVEDGEVATHLYHIAQEAVRNAIRLGRASRISIRLAKADANAGLELDIASDGIDFPLETAKRELDSRIMNQRAGAIGALLRIRPGLDGGARVTCSVPGSMGVAEVESEYDNATGSDQ